jgi:uncharacterized protein (DUF305 family)
MRTRMAAVVAAAGVVLVAATTAVAVTVADDGSGDRAGPRAGMMSAPWVDGSDDRPGGQRRGWMMSGLPGMMHSAEIRSEYDYLAEMVAHHREAVAAAIELQRSDRAEMRALGATIVTSQSAQIEQMQAWLADWYPDRSGRVDYQPMMRDLTGLAGDPLDRAFLQDMIVHHMAAVMMSQQLVVRGLAEHPAVAGLARTIRDDQHAEMFLMQQWLHEWFGRG